MNILNTQIKNMQIFNHLARNTLLSWESSLWNKEKIMHELQE